MGHGKTRIGKGISGQIGWVWFIKEGLFKDGKIESATIARCQDTLVALIAQYNKGIRRKGAKNRKEMANNRPKYN